MKYLTVFQMVENVNGEFKINMALDLHLYWVCMPPRTTFKLAYGVFQTLRLLQSIIMMMFSMRPGSIMYLFMNSCIKRDWLTRSSGSGDFARFNNFCAYIMMNGRNYLSRPAIY